GGHSDHATAAQVLSVRVEPSMVIAPVESTPPELHVWAKFADGKERDVTRFARFESLDTGLVEIVSDRLKVHRPGDTHVLAHYAGKIGCVAVLVPSELPAGVTFRDEPAGDVVDRFVLEKLKRLNIVPAELCNDN